MTGDKSVITFTTDILKQALRNLNSPAIKAAFRKVGVDSHGTSAVKMAERPEDQASFALGLLLFKSE